MAGHPASPLSDDSPLGIAPTGSEAVAPGGRSPAARSAVPNLGAFLGSSGAKTYLGSIGAFLVIVALWEATIRALAIPPYILPALQNMYDAFVHLFTKTPIALHIWVTFGVTVLSFVLGSALGMALGYPLGKVPLLEKVLSPYILGLQIAPKVAVVPLLILWFGFGYAPKILVGILLTFFPVLINVIVGIRVVNKDYLEVMRSLNASKWQVFLKVEFPSSLPMLFGALRIGATVSLIGVVVGELISANVGLGYLIVIASGLGQTAVVFSSIILLTVVGIVLYAGVVLAERRLLGWAVE